MGSTSTIAAAAGRRIGSTIAAGHRRRRETNGWPKAANGHAAGGLAERWAPCVALPPQSLEPLEPVARSHQRRAIAGSVGAIVEAPLGARPRTGAALVATQAPAGLERLRSPVERAAGGCRSRQVKATESQPPPMERPETPNTPIANRQSFASQQTRFSSAQAWASKHRGCQSARRTVGYSFIELNTVARPGP